MIYSRRSGLLCLLSGRVDGGPAGLARSPVDEYGAAELDPEAEGSGVLQLALGHHGGAIKELPDLSKERT